MNLCESKQTIRTHMRQLLIDAAVNEKSCREKSLAAGSALVESALFLRAEIILTFYPMRTEIDTRPIIDAAFAQGKRVALPRVNGNDIVFYFVGANKPLEAQMDTHPYGMKEPVCTLERLVPGHTCGSMLVLTPGLAFTARGDRLGHGKGYYDRFLTKLHTTDSESIGSGKTHDRTVCGLCYNLQICKTLPHDRFDVPVTFLASEQGVFHCSKAE